MSLRKDLGWPNVAKEATFDIRHVGQISTHRSTAGMAVEVGEH